MSGGRPVSWATASMTCRRGDVRAPGVAVGGDRLARGALEHVGDHPGRVLAPQILLAVTGSPSSGRRASIPDPRRVCSRPRPRVRRTRPARRRRRPQAAPPPAGAQRRAGLQGPAGGRSGRLPRGSTSRSEAMAGQIWSRMLAAWPWWGAAARPAAADRRRTRRPSCGRPARLTLRRIRPSSCRNSSGPPSARRPRPRTPAIRAPASRCPEQLRNPTCPCARRR